VHACVHRGVSAHMCMSICVYTVFLKKRLPQARDLITCAPMSSICCGSGPKAKTN
jgi:hypothetical protein